MRANKEYNTCKALSQYLRLQYPNLTFHWDLAGLNLSRAQAGMMKVLQYGRGWPDLFIASEGFVSGKHYKGLFLEIKADGTRLRKRDGTWATPHIAEQYNRHIELRKSGYYACFAVGFDEAKEIIDGYLNK